ncbi:MAG: glycosyltransferase family 4 protein [Halomonas sp.]|nr:glycosyltransferase family 4 protein [Halomonas sp.]
METFITAYNGSMKKGCWLRLQRLVTFMARQGYRIYLIVPEAFEVPDHPNLIKLPVGKSRFKTPSLERIGTAIRSALLAKGVARQATKASLLSFDTRNGLSFLTAGRWCEHQILFIRGETKYQAKYNEPFLYGLFIRALDLLVKRKADTIIYNNSLSLFREAELCRKLNIRSHKVPNDTCVAPQCRIPASRKTFTIGYCGQFTKRKNVEFLIQAFLALNERQPARLVLQGNWQGMIWVEKYLDRERYPNIQLNGWNHDTTAFYEEIDLFVLPSLFDDFSNAAVDAVTYGLPVLLSNTGGSPEIVEDNPTLLFDLRNGPLALAERIEHAMQHYASMCREVGKLAAKYSFNWEHEMLDLLPRSGPSTPSESEKVPVEAALASSANHSSLPQPGKRLPVESQ